MSVLNNNHQGPTARDEVKTILPLILAMFAVISVSIAYAAEDPQNFYMNRWMVTEAPSGTVRPPLTLEWERSPIWFESWNPSGRGEWGGRRVAFTEWGLVTVIRQTLYLIDKKSGETLGKLPLRGFSITDWKIADSVFVYASGESASRDLIIGAVDIAEHKEKWLHKEARPVLHELGELVISGDLVISVSNAFNRGADPIVALDIKTGNIRWKSSTDSHRALASYSWFIHGGFLNAFVTPDNLGLNLKRFDLVSGKAVGPDHIFGTDSLGNGVHPSVVTADGTTIIGYNKILRPNTLWLLAYNINSAKLLWSREIISGGLNPLMFFRHILGSQSTNTMVATVQPSRFIVFDSKKGAILTDARLPQGYVGWTDRNTSLYSYPYLLTGARRHMENGMAFDFIALNLETGKVDWSYEIETQNRYFINPEADILSFVVKDDRLYVGRSDAKIMSFRFAGSSTPN